MNNTQILYDKLTEKINLEQVSLCGLIAEFADKIKKNPDLVDDIRYVEWLFYLKRNLTPIRLNLGLEIEETGWVKEVCMAKGLSYTELLTCRIELQKRVLLELQQTKEVLVRMMCMLIDGLDEQETLYRKKLSRYRDRTGTLHFVFSLTPEGKEALDNFIRMRKCCARVLEYLKWLQQDIYILLKTQVFEDNEKSIKSVYSLLHNAEKLRFQMYQDDIF